MGSYVAVSVVECAACLATVSDIAQEEWNTQETRTYLSNAWIIAKRARAVSTRNRTNTICLLAGQKRPLGPLEGNLCMAGQVCCCSLHYAGGQKEKE